MLQRIPALTLIAPVAVAAAVSIRAQTPGSGYTTSTTAVIVDVVVRDAKGAADRRPEAVRLRAARGRRQAADRVGRADRARADRAAPASKAAETGRTAAGAAGRANAVPAQAGAATAIALVFHRLSADGRELASRAARGYLERSARPNDYAGVFVIDTRLETLQAFTTDVKKLAAAIERASTTQAGIYTRNQAMSTLFGERARRLAHCVGRIGRTADRRIRLRAARAGTNASQANPRADTQGMVQRLSEHMERAYEEMMRDRNGNAESAALTALVTAMGSLPGRKSVVLFSEGVAVPDTLEAKFRAVVDTANRSNVTIYAIDAKGLRLHSEQAATARGLAELRGVGDDDQRPEMVAERDRRSARTPTSSGARSC